MPSPWAEEAQVPEKRTRYDLQVFYEVTRADDIDIEDEGMYAREEYESPSAALDELGLFIQSHGGEEMWEDVDGFEMASCWLRHGPDTEIAYQARLDRVTSMDDDWPRSPMTRAPAMLTWKRLSAASPGFKRRDLTGE
jgi:hypothetical protein